MLLLKIILIGILILIFNQDIMERQVYWFLFPMLGACSGILFYSETMPVLFFTSVSMNFIFILILLFTLFLYAKLKLKSKFREVFGLGDVLLFICLIFSFSTVSFLIIFVFALIFSLTTHLLIKQFSKLKTVPLAGYISLFFAFVYLSSWTGITSSLYAI